jgi:methyl-accepting chemotaxis protein
VNVLGLPIDLPARAVTRALTDLTTLARVAGQIPARLDAIDARAETVEAQLDRALELGEEIDRRVGGVLEMGERIDARAEAVLEVGERIDRRADAVLDLGERIEASGAAMIEMGERLIELGREANGQAVVVADRAKEVADRGGELVAVLPTLERAVAMAAPLEGTVERLGRMMDRLPGARPPRGE